MSGPKYVVRMVLPDERAFLLAVDTDEEVAKARNTAKEQGATLDLYRRV